MHVARRLLLCSAVFVLLLTSHSAQQRPPLGSLARDQAPLPERSSRTGPTEQEWIVRDVATAIHQMVSAGTRRPSTPRAVQVTTAESMRGAVFSVARDGSSAVTVVIRDHLWTPSSYAPLASELGGPAACTAQGLSSVIRTLLDPRPDVLAGESARISTRLQADMRCADAHHEAALLVGAFALREAAGRFSDPRRLISRMTAHLAVAEAVDRGSASPVKRLADAVLLTLVGRQRDALNALASLESNVTDTEVQSWIRALRLRNTFDWRAVPKGARLTAFEQLSLLRALDMSVGNGASLERFEEIDDPGEIADWPRLLLQGDPGIEAGNRFSEYWIAAELAEFASLLDAPRPSPAPATGDALMKELNTEPADGPVGTDGIVRIIDRGTWAAATQRHLLMAVVARHKHLVGRLGLPGDARAFRDEASRSFSALSLYPLAATGIAYSRDEVARVFPRAATLVQTRPDLVTDHVWRTLQDMAAYAVLAPASDAASWFRPLVLPGTAFDLDSRSQPDGKNPRLTQAQVAELRQHAPYSRRLAVEAVRWRGNASYETLREEYGTLAPYDLELARALANAAWERPEIYVPLMERVCAMSADEGYWDLAPYLVDHGRVEEGLRAYERWLSIGRKEVTISNSMTWLVRHYHERGDYAKATAVADRVADTRSFWGLVTRANLHEWRDELDDAERLHRTAWKRYDNPNELLAFYLRSRRTAPEVPDLTREIFPAGMTRVTAGASAAAPREGVLIRTTGVIGADEGLRVNDVVVAVDSIRVRNVAQYRVARGASAHDTMKLILWRGGKYIELSARLRHRWVVSAIDTFQPGRSGN